MAVFFNVSVCESKREIMGVIMFLERNKSLYFPQKVIILGKCFFR